jgi:hypothetical protein
MKNKFCLMLICFTFVFSGIYSQDIPDYVWKSPMTKVYPIPGEYSPPPITDNNFVNPNTTTRVVTVNGQTFILPPNVRPFPDAATQSEVDAANMGGNNQVMYISWNSWLSPTFFGCGFAFTSNGGTSWTGARQTTSPNSGDPGPWIYPTGSTWSGRLGLSYISGAGFSTNNGTNWGGHVGYTPTGGFDKNLSAVDDISGSPFFGRAYTVWSRLVTGDNRIYCSRTTDGGATWSAGIQISPPTSSGRHHQGCDIEVGPGGVVYAIWANCVTNGQNSTEDSLGFARSTDGGVTWVSAANNYVDLNGIRALNLFNGIRANGFPRLAVDHTGGPRNGWIYVTLAEKNVAPATDVADVTLCRSTNGGVSWTHTRVNQDPPANGRYQYFPDVDVAPDGSVVISYYDQRNTSGFVTEYWLSRSTDGGNTWADVALSDHTFTPSPIPGLAGGYQGDYTGITCAAGKAWGFWADNSSGVYQVWTEGVTVGGGGGGIVNRCLRLPTPGVNTNYVMIPHQASMIGFSNITIEAWVKIGGSSTPNTVLNKGGSSFDYQLGINSGTTNPFFRAQTSITIATTMTITPNVWTHLAVTYDGTTVRFYKDAALGFSAPVSAPFGSSSNEMRIGRGGNDPGSGNLEEVRLWSVARTQIQIDSNKCRKWRNNLTSQTGLKAIWHFDSTYTDSVSGYNGTPTSGNVGFDTVSFPIPGVNCNLVGIQAIGNTVPEDYSLSQNYPNPFNPLTNIRFSIPKGEFVEIILYDITGKEVAVLFSDPLEAGTYKVDFNASNLASGVYFYKLAAGKFTDVKKMVLIK